jgi:molybdopterin-guanine dinucleotide biosynthesis adapter protein
VAARRGVGRGRGGRRTPIVTVSGPSGVGKTRLLVRLLRALTARGLTVAALKHTRHAHALDVPGKDTHRFVRAGAAAAAIASPAGTALFGPPVRDVAALARLLPAVDLVLAEGFRAAPLPRIEVHRRSVSRRFLCARDPRVFAVVGDSPPPRPLPTFRPGEVGRLADLLCRRFHLPVRGGLRAEVPMRRVSPGRSKRTYAPRRAAMPKTTARRGAGRTTRRSTTKRSRSDAGRKGGRATLRARGPEFFSEIGRKGGKSRSRNAAAARRAGLKAGGAAARPSARASGRRRGTAASGS